MTEASVPAAPRDPPAFPRGLRICSSQPDEKRYRRATDVLLLVPSLIAVAVLVVTYPPGPLGGSLPPVWGLFALRWLQRNGYL